MILVNIGSSARYGYTAIAAEERTATLGYYFGTLLADALARFYDIRAETFHGTIS